VRARRINGSTGKARSAEARIRDDQSGTEAGTGGEGREKGKRKVGRGRSKASEEKEKGNAGERKKRGEETDGGGKGGKRPGGSPNVRRRCEKATNRQKGAENPKPKNERAGKTAEDQMTGKQAKR